MKASGQDVSRMLSCGSVPGMSNWEETPGEDSGHAGGVISLGWPGNTLGSHRMCYRKWPGKRTTSLLSLLSPLTRSWISGGRWMDGLLNLRKGLAFRLHRN